MTKEESLKEAKKDCWFLSYHPEWNNDKEVVLTAIQQDGDALRFASDELRNDKGVVLAAIQQNSMLLYWASDKLKNDKRVVLAAVCNNGYALEFVSKD